MPRSRELPFDVESVSETFREDYDAKYVLVTGSVVRDREDYDDVDVYAVCETDGYNRTFDEVDIEGETFDILINSEQAYRSIDEFYYWYPENLITLIGMFSYAVPIIDHNELNEVRASIANPDDEVRFFIHSYHLGQLLRSRAKKDWKDLWVHTSWSVMAVVSAYWNEYPQTVHHDEYLDGLNEEQAELLAPMRTESGFSADIVDELIEITTPRFLDWMNTVRDGDTVEIHKRTQRRAIRQILDAHPSGSLDDIEIVGSKR